MENWWRAHVLFIPFPALGHLQPMLHFSRALASKGVKSTLATPLSIIKSIHTYDDERCATIEPYSDGCDGGLKQVGSVEVYTAVFRDVGSRNIVKLIQTHQQTKYPINCIIYSSLLPSALDIANQLGVRGASFCTQSCAVHAIHYHTQQGRLSTPVQEMTASLPGLPVLGMHELPTTITIKDAPFLSASLNQFTNIDEADWILINTFDKLEYEACEWMMKQWPDKMLMVGPTVSSIFYGNNINGPNVSQSTSTTCIEWLNTKPTGTVVYVSFGTIFCLGETQTEELAWGLKESNKYFLWVDRGVGENKFLTKFEREMSEIGLVVSWCPQLEVLAHEAVGCFITHCGWNSTLEALSFGTPMVAMPQFADQTTNAKFVEDVWEVGIRVKKDENGIVRREEIAECIDNVMMGETGEKIKKNVVKWKKLAKEAMDEGGSSDKNIDKIIAELTLS